MFGIAAILFAIFSVTLANAMNWLTGLWAVFFAVCAVTGLILAMIEDGKNSL